MEDLFAILDVEDVVLCFVLQFSLERIKFSLHSSGDGGEMVSVKTISLTIQNDR